MQRRYAIAYKFEWTHGNMRSGVLRPNGVLKRRSLNGPSYIDQRDFWYFNEAVDVRDHLLSVHGPRSHWIIRV